MARSGGTGAGGLLSKLATVNIGVTAGGAIFTMNKFSASATNAGRATEHFERTTKNLTRTLTGLGGYFGVRQLVEYADTWTLINSRVKLVTKSDEQAMAVQQRLFEISQKTRNTLAATSVLYTRVALNADQLGRSHNDLLNVVEAVNAAMLISGATGVESAQAMRQFAQALGSGRVQGDEFRTMMEAMPMVARAVSDEMGVAMGDLYKLSKKGLVDVQTVIDALLKKHDELVERSQKMTWTVGQSFEVLINAITRMVGIINMGTGASGDLGRALRYMAEHIDKVIAGLISLTSMILAYRAALISVYIAQQLVIGVQAIARWIELYKVVSKFVGIGYFLKLVSADFIKIGVTLAALTVGVLVYKKALEEITKMTEAWINANANLDDALGNGILGGGEENKLQAIIDDMLRKAHQGVVLSGLTGLEEERMAVNFEAVNKLIEARREYMDNALLPTYEAAILKERELALEALGIKDKLKEAEAAWKEYQKIIDRFAENLQRAFGDVFEKILNDGLKNFGDLFDAIKKLFFRLVAEMAAAKMMESIGAPIQQALGDIFGTNAQRALLNQQQAAAVEQAKSHLGETGITPETGQTVELTLEYESGRKWAKEIGKQIGIVLSAYMVGNMIGSQTTNPVTGFFGGALGGAAVGAQIGGVPGAIVGGAVGAIGGLIGALGKRNEKEEELRRALEAQQKLLAENSQALKEMRDSFEGRPHADVLRFQEVWKSAGGPKPTDNAWKQWQTTWPEMVALIHRMESLTGIKVTDEEGKFQTEAFRQLIEAVQETVRQLTQFGNNLTDVTSRINAYNKLFDVPDTPLQSLKDAYQVLSELAPDLIKQMGLANLDLNSPEARATLLAGLRDIFNLILQGELTPELLGAFADKNELLDAILNTKDAFDALSESILQITTDFPRAMDIIYYEQKYGHYGTNLPNKYDWERTKPPEPSNSWTVNGGITIVNEAGDSGEVLLGKIETAANARRARGGRVSVADSEVF